MKKLNLVFIVILLSSLIACNKKTTNTNILEPDTQPNPDLVIEDEPYFKYAWHFAYAYDEKYSIDYDINKDANIHITEAWKLTKGAGVTVAVIDAGSFDENHEDLKQNVLNTYNADFQDSDVSGTDNQPSHGTTVAGFIASPINGKGLVGAAPEAKLILIKQSFSSDLATIRAFKYAKDNGAQVINCSWGTNNVSQAVANYLQELKNDGITIIFASGNENCNLDQRFYIEPDTENIICTNNPQFTLINDESELPSVIGVGASSEFNDVTTYSNYGTNIDLLAPGGDSIVSFGLVGLYQDINITNSYSLTNGTSFSAPITTGVIALMLSLNPTLTPDQIREILIQSTDKIGNDATYIDGFDTRRAYGKLNATKAVIAARDF